MTFDDFWAAYPRRHPHANPKAPARHKFDALVKSGESVGELVQGAQGYAKAVEGEDPRYTCQAVTFLNQRRWEDYLPTPEELDDARKAKAEAMKAMASAVKRGENLAFINGDTLNELIEYGLISREEAQRAGYAA